MPLPRSSIKKKASTASIKDHVQKRTEFRDSKTSEEFIRDQVETFISVPSKEVIVLKGDPLLYKNRYSVTANAEVTQIESRDVVREVKDFRRLCIIIHILYSPLMIIVGAVKYDECPVNNSIPRYLVVGGCLGILFVFLEIIERYRNINVLIILALVMIVWFIHSSIQVFLEYCPDFFYPESGRYCDKTLYKFALWTCVIQTLIMLTLLLYLCLVNAYN